jgi:hypothetical protein
MARRFGFKPKLRELQQQSLTAQRFLAMGAPDEKRDAALAFIDEQAAKIKPVRARAAPRQLEAPVVNAIAELLAVHPRVLFAVRQNSGAASYEAKSGKYAPVHFYRILTSQPVTITDFWGILRDGRMFACEAKAPGWKRPSGDREIKQALFLSMITNCGGVALFATDAAQVAAALA